MLPSLRYSCAVSILIVLLCHSVAKGFPSCCRHICEGDLTIVSGIPYLRIYDMDRKLAICTPPKNGCTTLKLMWHDLHRFNVSSPSGVHENDKHVYFCKRCESLCASGVFELGQSSSSWTNVFISREPLSRFLSGYFSKRHSPIIFPQLKDRKGPISIEIT